MTSMTTEELTTKPELWSWWTYNFAFEPISIVLYLGLDSVC
jgi:hypothetical protein